jgi:6-phospho-beta-glucosidase
MAMKLCVIGGGGLRTPLLIRGLLARTDRLPVREVCLLDVNMAALGLIKPLIEEALSAAGRPFRVIYTADAPMAIAGSAFVLSTVRVGGIESRIIDEQVAMQHGVLGQETTGAGGFAYALRSIPAMLTYAELMRRHAPNAWLINFSNPAGLITQALTQYGGVKAFGICDTPPMTLKAVAGLLGVPDGEIVPRYAGLNHLGWFTGLSYRGQDLLPKLLGRVSELRKVPELAMFHPALIASLKALPTEYLYFFYYRDQAVANLQRAGRTRGEVILDQNRRFRDAMAVVAPGHDTGHWPVYYRYLSERQGTYMQSESGAAAPMEAHPEQEGYEGVALGMIESIVLGLNRIMIANVPNGSTIPELGPADVVEVPCTMTVAGPVPVYPGCLPAHALGLVQTVKAYERLTVEAAVEGSIEKGVLALSLHPLVGSYPLAASLMEAYVDRHAAHLPQFRKE